MKFEKGETVAVLGYNGVPDSVKIETVTNVTNRHIELGDGSQFSHGGTQVLEPGNNIARLAKLTPELEEEARWQKSMQVVKAVRWDDVDVSKLERIADILQEEEKFLTFKEAAEIVLSLASENVLEEGEVSADPEVLGPEREKQLQALQMVDDFFRLHM